MAGRFGHFAEAKRPNEFHIFVDAFGTAHHITRLFVAGFGFQTLPTCRKNVGTGYQRVVPALHMM